MSRSRRRSSSSASSHVRANAHERDDVRILSAERASAPATPPSQPPSHTPQPTSPAEAERIGHILKRVRERHGVSLEVIAEDLRIRPDFLLALENSRYTDLPADAYVIGFLRSYANHMGLDGQAAVEQYRREMAGRRRTPQLSMPTPITGGRAPTVAILIGAALAILLIYGLWYSLSSGTRAAVAVQPPLPELATVPPPTTAPPSPPAVVPLSAPDSDKQNDTTTANGISLPAPPPPVTTFDTAKPETGVETAKEDPIPETPTDSRRADKKPVEIVNLPVDLKKAEKQPEVVIVPPPPSVPPAQATAPQPPVSATGDPGVVLRADHESWVLVADRNGNTVFDKILKPGQSYKLPTGVRGYTLTTGNGGGLEVIVDGQTIPRLGADNSVIRGVPLDPDRLKKLATTARP